MPMILRKEREAGGELGFCGDRGPGRERGELAPGVVFVGVA